MVLEGDEVEGAEEALKGLLALFGFELTFPDFESVPALGFEGQEVFVVTLFVALDFAGPEVDVGLGDFIHGAPFVAMPEAAIDEDAGAESDDGEVGSAGKSFGMDTIAEAVAEEETAHEHFGSRVLRPDSAHTVAALGRGHRVGHIFLSYKAKTRVAS